MSLLSEVPAPVVLTRYDCREPRRVLSQEGGEGGMRWTELTGGEIPSAHGYRDKGKYWCGLLSSLVLFSLVVFPLSTEVVESYPVWGT
jgi:hypothetical protein